MTTHRRKMERIWCEEVAETLREWADSDTGPECVFLWGRNIWGICHHLQHRFGPDSSTVVTALMHHWPLYSGNPDFPAPHPRADAGVAFHYNGIDKWQETYGENRRDLCEFLAAMLDEWVAYSRKRKA
ncbi:hypothetical protein [Kineobactrum salinum]|uniref:Uncharacterized protein n=1 Tax=Kineobactrum salinum TaxID=2708301 RepID=A0A6C0U805_9GAMM|nr:hypothetical protein [Kineobactrum salinum]QIB67147.1 hypothetical protein G3T16_18820 [Kineobactrum salinum]